VTFLKFCGFFPYKSFALNVDFYGNQKSHKL
jgi:hypothetical protein